MKGVGGVYCTQELICHSEGAYSRREIWNRRGLGGAATLNQSSKSGGFYSTAKHFQTQPLWKRVGYNIRSDFTVQ